MVNFVDYDFYIVHGGALDDDTYGRLAEKAAAFIREITNCKTDNIKEEAARVIFDVKSAVSACVDELYRIETSGGVASESNDGVSVTYRTDRSDNQRLLDAVSMYLSPTGLLYRGI